MKMHFSKFLSVSIMMMLFLFSGSGTFAQNVLELAAGDYVISTAVAGALPGDVIRLTTEGGVYPDSTILVDKNITIESAAGLTDLPVIQYDSIATANLFNVQADLSLENVKIDMQEDILQTGYSVIISNKANYENKLKINGCEFYNGYRGFMNGSPADTSLASSIPLDSVMVQDCLFHGFTYHVVNFRGSKTEKIPAMRYVKFNNCSFYSNSADAHSLVLFAYDTTSAPASMAEISHITVDSGRTGIEINEFATGSYVRSCSITNCSNKPLLSKDRSQTLFEYCNTFNIGSGIKLVNVSPEKLISEDPMFTDRANNDFTLLETSPLIGAGKDSADIGDLRWVPDTGTSIQNKPGIALQFSLSQNYPNPFNPSTVIGFSLPKKSDVHLTVYDVLGKKVATLANNSFGAGYHEVMFDAHNLAAGVYIYRIRAGEFTSVKKLMLLK